MGTGWHWITIVFLVDFGFSNGESLGSVTIHSVRLLSEVVVRLSRIHEAFVLSIKFRENDEY
jgi:hypothetical protein